MQDSAIPDWSELTEAELATVYMQCRERYEKAKAAQERADHLMRSIKAAMLARMNAQGTTGFRADGIATVTRVTRTNTTCGDWTRFYEWLLQQVDAARAAGRDPIEPFAFLQKRLTSNSVAEYMAVEGAPPPAVNVTSEYDVRVTAAK